MAKHELIDGSYIIVKSGDTLWEIAEEFLGSGTKWKQLAALNGLPINDDGRIYVGQKIYITKDGKPSSSTKTTNTNKVDIQHFGLQANTDNTLFAIWAWNEDKEKETEKYLVKWEYYTADKVWFDASKTNTVDHNNRSGSRQDTYTVPSTATKIRLRVKPIAKQKTDDKTNKTSTPWTAEWSDTKTYNWKTDAPPLKPPTPSVSLSEDKRALVAELSNLDVNVDAIYFQVVKNDKDVVSKGYSKITKGYASYSYVLSVGNTYTVRCRSCRSDDHDDYSEWSDYSDKISRAPSYLGSGQISLQAESETSVLIKWKDTTGATSYDIEYAEKKEHFEGSDATRSLSNIETTQYLITGLESGKEYFFRVRTKNDNGESPWSDAKSIILGKAPAAPTTWSSTTTAVTGEDVTLYWIHNTEDGSSQVKADLELTIGGTKTSYEIKNSTNENERDKTSTHVLDTSTYTEGTNIKWRVRTYGITGKAGAWSTQRSITVYAKPTLNLNVTDKDGEDIETVTSFPIYLKGSAGPESQEPIGYHVTVTANDIYETTDAVGNPKFVNQGEAIYSKYFDITSPEPVIELSADNIDLENNIEYTVTATVSMNSGLTATQSKTFEVSWADLSYLPNAEIVLDEETLVANIRPYCEDYALVYYEVLKGGSYYVATENVLENVYGTIVKDPRTGYDVKTIDGDVVYQDAFSEEDAYYCIRTVRTQMSDVLLSVYRREFDGGFTEIAKDLDGALNTFVTDPHPALDFARYRIVAKSKTTGAVSYFDIPGYPVGGTSVIIQWDEDWSSFAVTENDPMSKPAWAGSMLRLPYNIDVADQSSPDVSLVNYIGRANPVSYYGTQRGKSATWSVVIDKNDKETLYALRRLDNWMGDVYVREPSGSGYWANIKVSFSQKHTEVTIPVTLDIKRVEGGI